MKVKWGKRKPASPSQDRRLPQGRSVLGLGAFLDYFGASVSTEGALNIPQLEGRTSANTANRTAKGNERTQAGHCSRAHAMKSEG